jgi:hypothetical protein
MLDRFVGHGDIVAFAEERVNLKREDVEEYRAQVRRLRDKLGSYISEHPAFDVVKMLHSGSVAKGTALKVINDMDVAVYVKKGKAPEREDSLLEWTAGRLKEAYGNTLKPEQIKIEHHCVSVKFQGTGLYVDVVPVLYEGDPDDRGYLIPPSTGIRVLTSIPLHLAFARSKKNIHKTHYRQMVRLVKWWARIQKNQRTGFRFKSFMTELILAHLFDDGFNGDDYAEGLFQFFSYVVKTNLSERIIFTDHYSASEAKDDGNAIQIFDPVNPENNVASRYQKNDVDIIIDAAADALDAISFARRATTKAEAVDQWQVVFGTSFKGS